MRTLSYPIRSDKLAVNVAVTDSLCKVRTDFQLVEILETEVFGRMLLLDGHVQLAEFDEFAYHEALVHIPALSIRPLKRALVVGGGDGGVLRELCRHRELEQIDMVEIDQGVIDACRKHLPALSDGAFDDPRVRLFVQDAFPFVRAQTGAYDLIVVDSTDVYEEEEGELSEQLFTAEFYRDCLEALTPNGMVVTQADNLVFCPYSVEEIEALFKSVFPVVGTYQSLVPSFGGYSGYCWGSKGMVPSKELPANTLELRYLTETTYRLAFERLPF